MAEIQQVLQAQAATEAQLLAKQNVVGVAVGFKESEGVVTDQLAVIALVQEKKPVAQLAESDMIPRSVAGIRTDVYEVGDLRAQSQLDPKSRFRPTIPAGVSIGHYRITAGTLGVVVRDRTTGDRLLLSNNHVFANSNGGITGDAILQPGPLDGGQNPGDLIARLERFIPLRFVEDANQPDPGPEPIPTPDPNTSGCLSIFISIANAIASLTGSSQRVSVSQAAASSASSAVIGTGQTVTVTQALTPDNALDAALVRPVNPAMFDDAILNIGNVSGTKPPVLGMSVRKSGRTTGLTQGKITLLNATINITYDTAQGARTARFTGQCLTESISQGGDSGSLIVDAAENKAVGLLFAGSPVATVFTPIDAVLVALNVII
ncbi:MAG TPA: hypothetical protein VHL11_06260 [Phototrophicaceae bacterium]|jgi:hypothetical protein|nr:hypothetical protein [Phototrophicaceae bacterium]